MATIPVKPPGWFLAVSLLFLLWGAAGLFAFYAHVSMGPSGLAAMSAYDRQFFQALPGWFTWVYAMATWPAVIASAALLVRSRIAVPLYLVSLIGVIVQFGWVFTGTDLIAAKGGAATVPFPLLILALAAVQVWFARTAVRRGWLR